MGLKLCYIWVERYRNFQNLGVNFSSTEKFHFRESTGLLTCEHIDTLPKKFFENNRIQDVTGIIGKNGTGKSNLLELVCSLLKGGHTGVDTTFLIIVKKNGNYECHSSVDLSIYVNTKFNIDLLSYQKGIEPLKVIYFSNVFDEREHYFDSKVSNLSGNYRYKTSRYATKKTSPFVKQLQFVRSSFMDLSEIPYPKDISISIKKLNVSQRTRRLIFLSKKSSNEFEENLTELYQDISRLGPSKEKLQGHILFSLILDFASLVQPEFEDSIYPLDLLIGNTENLFSRIEEVKLTFKSKLARAKLWQEWLVQSAGILFEWESSNLNIPQNVSKDIKELEGNIKMLERFDEFIDSVPLSVQVEGSRNRKEEKYIIPFRRDTDKLEEKFYNYFDKDSKFVLNWLGLSSGHKAYLDFFSLLWFELKSIKTENVIICIDEGDLYLHPKWQADFFYKIITLIPKFRGVNFQFVLTSHSPFLVSDLPAENLVFLTTGESDDRIMVANNTDLKTFGGNLGELYIDAFFMEGSLISRFAAKKIQEVVDKINSKDRSITIDDRKLINLIGEDLIRLQIENLIDGSDRG